MIILNARIGFKYQESQECASVVDSTEALIVGNCFPISSNCVILELSENRSCAVTPEI